MREKENAVKQKVREREREGEGAKEENASIYFARINCNY